LIDADLPQYSQNHATTSSALGVGVELSKEVYLDRVVARHNQEMVDLPLW
jgi:hypothetical protein